MKDERTSSDANRHRATSAVDELRLELAATRAHLQAFIAQLEAGNEELRAANEEVVSSNEKLLSEARDYADCIVNTIREPLVMLDEQRRIRSANPAFCSAFQIGSDTVEGRSLAELGGPLWMGPTLQGALDRLGRGETVENERIELVSPTLGERTMVLSGRPMARGPDRPRWCLLAFDDVTEGMKAGALARRSEKAMRDMLGAASESIVIAGEDGVITFANAMAARTFGYAPDELVGLGVETLVPEAVRAAHVQHRAVFHGTSRRQEMSPDQERWGRRKDGSLFPIEVTLSAMEGERGPLGVAFVSDITERRRTEARIRAYERKLQETAFEAAAAEERQRRRIAAGLHDNIGQALALAQIRLKSAQGALGAAAHPDLDEALRLIGQAITDTRSLTFELSPPVLYELGLPAAVGWLGDQLEARHAMRVSVESDDPLATLDDDTAAVLFRSVRELLANVVKHADTAAASVEMRREENELSVVVQDHGAGFDTEGLRAYETTSGFGLFSVGEQIRRLGGSIDIASRPGQGTKITLRVLVAARTSDAPPRGPK